MALGKDDVAELHRRTEGWPACLAPVALSLREGASPGAAAISTGGGHRFVSEYVEAEFLARISRRQRVFLTRTAVLERMCGPLCEAVLDRPGSAAALADLALYQTRCWCRWTSGGQWYRYHHLFRDMLLAQSKRHSPGLIPLLQRRAASRYVRNGMDEEALEYPIAAGDVDGAARLVEKLWLPCRAGKAGPRPCSGRGVAGRPGRDQGTPDARRGGPRSCPRRWGGRPRPCAGPMWSSAGGTRTRPGPRTLPPRGGPPCSGPTCAAAGSSRRARRRR